MSAAAPLISVILPVYNCAPYLAAAVRSVQGQTRGDFELIAIDDGSTDKSLEILRQLAEYDVRMRIISRANTGYTRALNEALALAQGALIARMDGDDLCEPRRFEWQVSYMQEHPDCVAVGGRALLIDPQDRPIRHMGQLTDHPAIDAANLAGHGGTIIHPAAMIRRSAIERLGGYRVDLEPAEDLDLFLRLAEMGQLANLPQVVLRYRQHPNSVGHVRRVQQAANALRAVQDARRRRGLPPLDAPPPEPQDAQSPPDQHCKWAWWALAEGFYATARFHAWQAVKLRPSRWNHWKALACSLRGY